MAQHRAKHTDLWSLPSHLSNRYSVPYQKVTIKQRNRIERCLIKWGVESIKVNFINETKLRRTIFPTIQRGKLGLSSLGRDPVDLGSLGLKPHKLRLSGTETGVGGLTKLYTPLWFVKNNRTWNKIIPISLIGWVLFKGI